MQQKGIKDNLKESGGINITMNTNTLYLNQKCMRQSKGNNLN